MPAGCEAPSCFFFLRGHTTHQPSCAFSLFFTLSGQCKVISTARFAFQIAAYTTTPPGLKKGLGFTANVLDGVKTVLHVVLIPTDSISWTRHCKQMGRGYHDLYHTYREGRCVGARSWIEVGTTTAGFAKKTLSLLEKGLFKPLHLIGKTVDLGSRGQTLKGVWNILSLAKTTALVCEYTGQIYLSSRDRGRRVVRMALGVGELVCKVFRCTQMGVHPIARIVVEACKILYGVALLWMKTP